MRCPAADSRRMQWLLKSRLVAEILRPRMMKDVLMRRLLLEDHHGLKDRNAMLLAMNVWMRLNDHLNCPLCQENRLMP